MVDDFELLGNLSDVEVIAINVSIRELKKLKKQFGGRRCANSKELAQLDFRMVRFTGLNCTGYEAHGIGKRKLKIKRRLD